MSHSHTGRKPVGQVEEMASKRKRQLNELKNLIEDQQKRFEELFEKQEQRMEDQKRHFEQRFENQQNQITNLTTDLRSSRRDIRAFSYCQMLNTYLNIIKFANEDDPRSVVELHAEAHRFSAALDDHKAKGDVLDLQETKFLDVFSKIDELCAVGVGNLRL